MKTFNAFIVLGLTMAFTSCGIDSGFYGKKGVKLSAKARPSENNYGGDTDGGFTGGIDGETLGVDNGSSSGGSTTGSDNGTSGGNSTGSTNGSTQGGNDNGTSTGGSSTGSTHGSTHGGNDNGTSTGGSSTGSTHGSTHGGNDNGTSTGGSSTGSTHGSTHGGNDNGTSTGGSSTGSTHGCTHGGNDNGSSSGGGNSGASSGGYHPPGHDHDGIRGGHFDIDTSHLVYEFNRGKTDHHSHAYDKKHRTNGVNFFNLIDKAFGEINELIDNSTRFVLSIANAELSPGAMLEINGKIVNALDLQNGNRDLLDAGLPLQAYTMGLPSVSGDIQLKSFKVFFDLDVIAQGGLIATKTGCVKLNKPGALGEYRNGALVIQALNRIGYNIAPQTGVAAMGNGALLWESTLFWHWESQCY